MSSWRTGGATSCWPGTASSARAGRWAASPCDPGGGARSVAAWMAMTDNITLPVAPSTATIATDEVDLGAGLAHAPFGKLIDGRDGGTARLGVSNAGGIISQTKVAGVFGF